MNIDPNEYDPIPSRTPGAPDIEIDFASLEECEHVGSGGTADVVKMRSRSGTTVAVKQPRFQGTLDEHVVDAFVSEAETWAKIDDLAGVVDVFDWSSTPVPWIALEYMDGGSLADRIDRMSIDEVLWISGRVADAVQAAHRRGVAHLDLKPDNILFRTTKGDRWNVPKVSDWGLAKLLLHHSRDVDGLSPRYSAPEQFDPETYGHPDDVTDIYQLGTIVYDLLIGEPPFSGTASAVMNSHLTESPRRPTAIDSTLPDAVDYILGTALTKEKENRYESMLDFRRDLISLLRTVVFGETTSLICSDHPSRPGDVSERVGSASGNSEPDHGNSTERIDAGSSFGRDTDAPGILDSIQDQSGTGADREFPWQRRTNAPGLSGNADGTLRRERPLKPDSGDETARDSLSSGSRVTGSGEDRSPGSTDGLLTVLRVVLKRLFDT